MAADDKFYLFASPPMIFAVSVFVFPAMSSSVVTASKTRDGSMGSASPSEPPSWASMW